MTDNTGAHASRAAIAAYATGDPALPAAAEWAVEAHLETCADCRAHLADAVRIGDPTLDSALRQVWTELDARAPRTPAPGRPAWSRWARTWAPPTLAPRLATGVLVALVAFLVDLVAPERTLTPLVLLVAPVAPLFGVAAAWSRRLDPLHELTASTPRAGLAMVLRRTAVVLAAVIPVLAAAGALTGLNPALWLLPCLAFTTGALALGTVFGVDRAALGLGLLWTVLVIAPTVMNLGAPQLLRQSGLPGWAAAAAVAAAVLTARARSFTALPDKD